MTDHRTKDLVFDPATWPRVGERYICTLSHPRPAGASGGWVHTDYEDAGECSEGCCDRYRCRACGKIWNEEVAQ
jgi:hypothetical protein